MYVLRGVQVCLFEGIMLDLEEQEEFSGAKISTKYTEVISVKLAANL